MKTTRTPRRLGHRKAACVITKAVAGTCFCGRLMEPAHIPSEGGDIPVVAQAAGPAVVRVAPTPPVATGAEAGRDMNTKVAGFFGQFDESGTARGGRVQVVESKGEWCKTVDTSAGYHRRRTNRMPAA